MKKIFAVVLVVLVLCSGAVSSQGDIPVYINGEKLVFDVQPQMINDRVMVPMRFIFEKLGATVHYEESTQTITAMSKTKEDKMIFIFIQIDNTFAFVNNPEVSGTSQTYTLDSPPVLVDGRTLVPVRFVSESFGCKVDWNDKEQAVYITKN
ncbi:MAG: hypothetical protein BWY15_00660 [Firmicutes bacterium ADurb.Bin193]|nr:MAG: hypothetical protein BWY15_00660 [Firmicutes bacterium ADurb.Bin193]